MIVSKFQLPVQQSLSAFIIPDTLGVLAPNEIFIATDEQLLIDPATQRSNSFLLGPVLALRLPCKLPSDIQKMEAVYKPELAHLRNVIVMSADTACQRSPASELAGGDYDGDTVQLYWNAEMVATFTAAEKEVGIDAEFEDSNFKKQRVSGTEVLARLQGRTEEEKLVNLQHFLLGGLRDDYMTAKCELKLSH
jgi:hypothetical protein